MISKGESVTIDHFLCRRKSSEVTWPGGIWGSCEFFARIIYLLINQCEIYLLLNNIDEIHYK
jgi:hypothetical protein